MAILAGSSTSACADRYSLGTLVTAGDGGAGGAGFPDGGPRDADAAPPPPPPDAPPVTDGEPAPPDLSPPGVCTKETSCRLAANLDQSGTSNLGDGLVLGGATVTASLRYQGENANAAVWMGARGPSLTRSAGTPALGLETPFTDNTRAVGLGGTGAVYLASAPDAGSLGTDDFVLELVFRAGANAGIVSKGVGWAVSTLVDGAVALDLNDGTRTVRAGTSGVLLTRTWYHCLFWVSRGNGARVDCNGRPTGIVDPAALGALGPVGAAGTLAIGGANPAAGDDVQVALFQLFRVASGMLGAAPTWTSISRRRFAELTGVFPQFATGTPLPAENLRGTPAYLDMQRVAGGPRRLFLVGHDWPRIACRTDGRGARSCGYLAEPGGGRRVEPLASAWTASEATVVASDVPSVDPDQRMEAITASAANARHTLVRIAGVGGVRNALSFYVRAGSSQKVGVSVGTLGMAVFDLATGTVTPAPGLIAATIEPWGNGVFRCGYIYQNIDGQTEHRIHLLNGEGADTFLGDGTPVIHVAGFQLDANTAYPSSLMAVSPQGADRLTFLGADGNLPLAGPVQLSLRVNLPPWPRYLDEAVININRGGATNDQINLFIVGYSAGAMAGVFQFMGLSQGATHWTVRHPTRSTDGFAHTLVAEWGGGTARLSIDGQTEARNESNVSAALYTFDRIDVGFSLRSSTYLQGLVSRLELKGQ
ncbi:MAG TPA: hypothetical protein VGG33_14360 [Polyangia bacterium]